MSDHCKNCGAQLPAGASVCENCGGGVTAVTSELSQKDPGYQSFMRTHDVGGAVTAKLTQNDPGYQSFVRQSSDASSGQSDVQGYHSDVPLKDQKAKGAAPTSDQPVMPPQPPRPVQPPVPSAPPVPPVLPQVQPPRAYPYPQPQPPRNNAIPSQNNYGSVRHGAQKSRLLTVVIAALAFLFVAEAVISCFWFPGFLRKKDTAADTSAQKETVFVVPTEDVTAADDSDDGDADEEDSGASADKSTADEESSEAADDDKTLDAMAMVAGSYEGSWTWIDEDGSENKESTSYIGFSFDGEKLVFADGDKDKVISFDAEEMRGSYESRDENGVVVSYHIVEFKTKNSQMTVKLEEYMPRSGRKAVFEGVKVSDDPLFGDDENE